MKKIWNFLLKVWSGESDVSSKRVAGTTILFTCMEVIMYCSHVGKEINPNVSNALIAMIITGGALLGINVVENIKK